VSLSLRPPQVRLLPPTAQVEVRSEGSAKGSGRCACIVFACVRRYHVVVYGPYPPCEGRTRWRLQVYDPATKRKQNLTAESEEAARALIPLLEIEFKRHSPLLLHEVLAQYLEYKATIAQERSGYYTLGERLRSFLPNVPVQRLTLKMQRALYENETKRVGRFGVVSAATHQALLRNTKEFFRWLCKRKLATKQSV
jgi:hypothetical protein